MGSAATDGPVVIALDVSGLEPPEPMERIFAQLHALQAGELLRVRHRREPYPIYPLLTEAGFRHCCLPTADDRYFIYIWPESSSVDEVFCRRDAGVDGP